MVVYIDYRTWYVEKKIKQCCSSCFSNIDDSNTLYDYTLKTHQLNSNAMVLTIKAMAF
jgi:hypothetical protein